METVRGDRAHRWIDTGVLAQEPSRPLAKLPLNRRRRKSEDPAPIRSEQGRGDSGQIQYVLTNGQPRWHVLPECLLSGGFTLGAGYSPHVSSYTRWTSGAATISGWRRSGIQWRLACSTSRPVVPSGRLARGDAQVGFYGIGTDTSKTTGRTTCFSSHAPRQHSRSFPHDDI